MTATRRRLLVRRTGALGDVVLATAVVRRLREENPNDEIGVLTAYPDVFRGNPHVDVMLNTADGAWLPDRTVDLDLAYERRPDLHIVDAYMEEAFGDREGNKRQEMFFPRKRLFGAPKGYVAVHAAQAGWRNRTLPAETWLQVCDFLRRGGFWPILIGSERDRIHGTAAENITSFHCSDLHATAQLIHSCACFVGSDSGLLHVAGATDTPIVGVFTSALPERRLPFRRDCVAVSANVPCVGCLHRRWPPPVTTEACERGDIACVHSVDAGRIVQAVDGLIASRRI